MNVLMTLLMPVLAFFAVAVVLAFAGVTGPALVAVALVAAFAVGMAVPTRARCAYCRKSMRSEATVCPHCGRAVDDAVTA